VRGDHDSCLSLRRNQFEDERRLSIKPQNQSHSHTNSQIEGESILHEPNNKKEKDLSLVDRVIFVPSSEDDADDTISDRRRSIKLQDRSPSSSSQTNDESTSHNNKKVTDLGLIDQVILVLSSEDDDDEDAIGWQTLFVDGAIMRAMLDLADCCIPHQMISVHSSEDDDVGTGWQALFEGGVRNTNLNEGTPRLFDLEPRSIEEMISRTES
jgi:hypothetical protein